jgi:iron complex outermembrane receptor protein
VPGDGSYVQFNPQISVTTGGNPNLQPEEADSFTLGAVYDADWVADIDWIEKLQVEQTETRQYALFIDDVIQLNEQLSIVLGGPGTSSIDSI